MTILFVVWTVSITIFKIDAKVFDGFALKFLQTLLYIVWASHAAFFSLRALSGSFFSNENDFGCFVKRFGQIL